MAADPIDDSISRAHENQEQQREHMAKQSGQARREKIQKDPAQGGSPQDDGYGGMNEREKNAYKKGYSGN